MVPVRLWHLALWLSLSSAFVIRRTKEDSDEVAYTLDEGQPRRGIPEINAATGRKFFEGDIILPPEKNALRNSSYRWKIPVPYIMGNTLDLNTKGVILQAFEMFRLKSCIDFKPYEGEKSYLQFEKLDGCWSYVGDFKTGQNVSIGQYCEYKHTVEHEILHALGFYHEQSRSDRNDYVNIWWDEVMEGQAHNFNTYNDEFVSDLNTPYDYESVMHYGPYSFNKNSSIPTITTKIPEFNDVIGQSQDLSRIDLERLNQMYRCASSLTLLDQCSFEAINICGMVQSTKDDTDWQHTLTTPEDKDHTFVGRCKGRGYFMHLNTSAGQSGESAILESRLLYPKRTVKCVQFFYKFDGSPQDKLVVWIKRDDGTGNVRKMVKLQTFDADEKEYWQLASVPFHSQTKFRYVFQSIRGSPSNSTGGISIDDVSLTETQCPTGVWQITNITSLLNSTSKGDYISSPLFYSSEGYCYVLRLYPHDSLSSTGNYLGIRFALCSGEDDGGLEWPAGNRQVTFTIVDQDPDVTQRMSPSRVFTTDPSLLHNGQLFWDKPSRTGSFDSLYNRNIGPYYGWYGILHHRELQRRSFLKNDALVIFASFEVVEDPGSVL